MHTSRETHVKAGVNTLATVIGMIKCHCVHTSISIFKSDEIDRQWRIADGHREGCAACIEISLVTSAERKQKRDKYR